MAELYRSRIAAMLATDTYMHVRTYWLAKLDRHLHQLAHTGLIQFGKRIIFKNLGIIVSIQELDRKSVV